MASADDFLPTSSALSSSARSHSGLSARARSTAAIDGLRDLGVLETGVEAGERDREVGLGALRVGAREIADEPVDGDLVRLLREHAVELEERLGDARAARGRVGEELLEPRAKIRFRRVLVDALGHRPAGRQRREDLRGTLRAGLDLLPESRRLRRHLALAREQRDLGGTPRDRRVARLPRDLEQRACGQRGLAALQGDIGEQQPVEDVGGEARRIGRGRIGRAARLGRRGRGNGSAPSAGSAASARARATTVRDGVNFMAGLGRRAAAGAAEGRRGILGYIPGPNKRARPVPADLAGRSTPARILRCPSCRKSRPREAGSPRA